MRGTSHWVSEEHCLDAEVRIYDHLFLREDPSDLPDGGDFTDNLNPDSLRTITAKVEPSLADARPGDRFQFLRQGYFCVDTESAAGALVLNGRWRCGLVGTASRVGYDLFPRQLSGRSVCSSVCLASTSKSLSLCRTGFRR